MVSSWLEAFRTATTDMSKTKQSMLSTVHAIFRGLQDHVKLMLSTLPDTAPQALKNGLVQAHMKLSDYYGKTDTSPLYMWAASMLSL